MAESPALKIQPSLPPPVTVTRTNESKTLAWHVLSLKSQVVSEPPLEKKQIEEYRRGYPQFTSLIATHGPWHCFRRFRRIHARLLLLQQDMIVELETKLEEVDRDEEHSLFLGNRRRDTNTERNNVLARLKTELKEYDAMVERGHKMLNCPSAKSHDVTCLKNWVNNNGSIARDETAYLSHEDDLMCIGVPRDDTFVLLERIMEDAVIKIYRLLGKRPSGSPSRDPDVFIFSGTFIQRATRAILAWLIVLLVMGPVVVISLLTDLTVRMIIMVVATAIIIALLAILTKVRTWEMFLAGATYATILVVFISGNTTPQS